MSVFNEMSIKMPFKEEAVKYICRKEVIFHGKIMLLPAGKKTNTSLHSPVKSQYIN